MAGLLSLPTENILDIFTFAGATSTRSLVRLSAANRRLREIWLQHSQHIIEHALQLKAPAHKDALALTLIEAQCHMPTTRFHLFDETPEHPPLRLCLPQLARNIGLASEVCDRMPAYNNQTGGDPLTYPLEPVYYLMWKLVVAYHYPELRPPLISDLKRLSQDKLHTWWRMGCYLMYMIPNHLSVAHPMHTWVVDDNEPDGDNDDSQGAFVLVDEWEFAVEVGIRLWQDRIEGRTGEPDQHYCQYGGRR